MRLTCQSALASGQAVNRNVSDVLALVGWSASLGRTLLEREQHGSEREADDCAAQQPQCAAEEWPARWREPIGIRQIAQAPWSRLEPPPPLLVGRPLRAGQVDCAEETSRHRFDYRGDARYS